MLMDKWIEIDVAAVEHNLREVKTLLGEKTRLIAVVKANAYGHGADETARILCQNGVDFLAVSFLTEALQLRQAGIIADILIFSPIISLPEAQAAVGYGLTLTVASERDLELLAQATVTLAGKQKIHLKIDTGLGRFGLNEQEAVRVCQLIARQEHLYLEGIYTHTADPTEPSYTAQQFERFMEIVKRLERDGREIPIKHAANSAVLLRSPEMYLDAVRIGTLLAGQHPVGNFPIRLQLQDPFKFKSRIISLRSLAKGSFLGYYRTFRLREAAQIAVIPVGFNDGLALEVANPPAGMVDMLKKLVKNILIYINWPHLNLMVGINGHKYPVRGKVFMQMALVEIPPGVVIKVGDEVEVPVRKTLASAAIPRIYIQPDRSHSYSDPQRMRNLQKFKGDFNDYPDIDR